MTDETPLRLRPDRLDWRVIDDEIVMLDAEQSQYLATNASGTLLWQTLQHGATRTQLVELLVSRYAIAEEQARSDTDVFLAELRARDLIAEA